MNKLILFIKELKVSLTPPRRFRLHFIVLGGIFAGLAAYTIYISRAWSYLSDSPRTCINCHVMTPQYATWSHSSHRESASCNDCHVPQGNIVRHYLFKATDGARHATLFTLRMEDQVIRIKSAGKKAVQENCLRCHQGVNMDVMFSHTTAHNQKRQCWDCHREVPHGRVGSLASVPFTRVPLPGSTVPDWLKNLIQDDQ